MIVVLTTAGKNTGRRADDLYECLTTFLELLKMHLKHLNTIIGSQVCYKMQFMLDCSSNSRYTHSVIQLRIN